MRPVVAAAMVAVLFVTPALGQNASAPDPSAASSILYAASDSADDRDVGWLSTDSSEGASATVGGTKPEDCLNGELTGNGLPAPLCEAPAFEWTWTYTLSPALRGPVRLDPAGKIKLVAFLGAGTGAGTLSVTTKLAQGDTTVAEGAATAHEYANSPAGENYGSVVWDVTPATPLLAAGTALVWTVTVAGEEGGSGSLFMAVGEPRGRSHVELPVTGGGSSTAEALTGASLDFNKTVDTASNDTFLYTWVGPTTTRAITVAATGRGSVSLVIRTGNDTVATINVTAPGPLRNLSRDVSPTSGNWSFALKLTAFNGTVHVQDRNPIPPSAGTGTSTGAGAGNSTDDGKKDTPAPALPALFGTVAVALVLSRRRRQA